MSSWFDAPGHRPPSTRIEVGDSVEGTITQLGIETNLRGNQTLTWTIDGGPKRWANMRLWRTMADARVNPGDTVRITRGPDQDSGGSMPATTWTVERLGHGAISQAQAQPQPQPQVPAW